MPQFAQLQRLTIRSMDMVEETFTAALRGLDGTAICAIAGGLDALARTTDDSERLEVMIDIDRALRQGHLERQGAGAARQARDLVTWAAKREHLDPEQLEVVTVSRTAADVARSFIAGESIGDRALRHVRHWMGIFGFQVADDGLWLPA